MFHICWELVWLTDQSKLVDKKSRVFALMFVVFLLINSSCCIIILILRFCSYSWQVPQKLIIGRKKSSPSVSIPIDHNDSGGIFTFD